MQPLSLDGLRLFVLVARVGSFSAAADEIGAAQSSVSERIARLEAQLEYPLLTRTQQGVELTARGRDVLTRVGDAFDALSAAAADLGRERESARFSIGGPAEFLSEVLLAPLVAALAAGVAEVGGVDGVGGGELSGEQVAEVAGGSGAGAQVTARFGLPEDLLASLREGSLDAVVVSVPVRGGDLRVEPLYDEEFVLVSHPGWCDSTALSDVPVVAYAPELPLIRRYWQSVFLSRPESLRVAACVPDLRALRELARAGVGMTVLPRYLAREDLARGRLVELHVPKVAPLNTLYVVTLKPTSRAWRANGAEAIDDLRAAMHRAVGCAAVA